MSTDYTVPPWAGDPASSTRRPPAPEPIAGPAPDPAGRDSVRGTGGELTAADYRVVEALRDRVSTSLSLALQDRELAPAARRELARMLIREEWRSWVLHEAHSGRPEPTVSKEELVFATVLADLEGNLGRLGPLLARTDIEDIQFEGNDPTTLLLRSGQYVQGPPIADSDEDLVKTLTSLANRSEDGETSREFSPANPSLDMRLPGPGPLGARLHANMSVVRRPAGTIRVHHHRPVTLDDLVHLNMIDRPLHALLHAAVAAKASILVTGMPAVGKTTLLRALGTAISQQNVVVVMEDTRELGLDLPVDVNGRQRKRYAACRSFETRQANADGAGGFSMNRALHDALRMSPTWAIVGEVRGAYVVELLDTVSSGVAAVMCTIHSPAADLVFDKVLTAAKKAGQVDTGLVMRTLASLDLLVHVTRDRHHQRFVSDVYELGRYDRDTGEPAMHKLFVPRAGDERAVATGPGAMSQTFAARLARVGFDPGWLQPERSTWAGAPPAPVTGAAPRPAPSWRTS